MLQGLGGRDFNLADDFAANGRRIFLVAHLRQAQYNGKIFLQFDMSLVFTWEAAVVVSLLLMYRTTRGAFEQLEPNIIAAARTLGVSERKIFWRIVLPNTRFGILAGTVLACTSPFLTVLPSIDAANLFNVKKRSHKKPIPAIMGGEIWKESRRQIF